MKRRVLTVSEVNQMLIRKGYRSCETIHIDIENSWEADTLVFEENTKMDTAFAGFISFINLKAVQ